MSPLYFLTNANKYATLHIHAKSVICEIGGLLTKFQSVVI